MNVAVFGFWKASLPWYKVEGLQRQSDGMSPQGQASLTPFLPVPCLITVQFWEGWIKS